MCFLSCAPFLCFWECCGVSPEVELEHANACAFSLLHGPDSNPNQYISDSNKDCQKIHQYFQRAITKGAPKALEGYESFKKRLAWHNEGVGKGIPSIFETWSKVHEQNRLLARTDGER